MRFHGENMKLLLRGIVIVAGFGLAACSAVSLAADVTPPPDYVPVSSQPQAAPEAAKFPLLPPDVNEGAAVYAEKCEPCHGATGMGDGAQSDKLPEPPPAIGSSEVARAATLSDWYALITNGRLEKFMPGFVESLSDRQRWDVAAYAQALHITQSELELGKSVYDAQCASCHGPDAKGISQKGPDLTNLELISATTLGELEQLTANGNNQMPAFAAILSQEEIAAAISYTRSLAIPAQGSAPTAAPETGGANESGAAQPTSTPVAAGNEATADPDATLTPQGARTFTLNGKISFSSGEAAPGGLPVVLMGFENMTQVMELEATSKADGSYTFENVDVKDGMAYMVKVTSDGFDFNSDILHSSDITTGSAELPVPVSPISRDTSGLLIDRMHVFFDFNTPGTVQVVELFIVTNPSGQLIVPDGEKGVLTFDLPEGAGNLQFDGGALGDRFIATEKGFSDLQPIQPNAQSQVLFSYDMAYDRKLKLDLALPFDVNAAVVMLPPGGVKLQSDQLMASGSRDVQGMTFQLFTGAGLKGGSNLTINLSGAAAAQTGTTGNNLPGLMIGLGAFGLVLVGAGYWFLRERNKAAPEDADEDSVAVETEDDLLDAILALDDLHQAGKIPDEAYRERRAELKARLQQMKTVAGK